MPYRCCDHCVDDPGYHANNPPDSHDTYCSGYGRKGECDSGGDNLAPQPTVQDHTNGSQA